MNDSFSFVSLKSRPGLTKLTFMGSRFQRTRLGSMSGEPTLNLNFNFSASTFRKSKIPKTIKLSKSSSLVTIDDQVTWAFRAPDKGLRLDPALMQPGRFVKSSNSELDQNMTKTMIQTKAKDFHIIIIVIIFQFKKVIQEKSNDLGQFLSFLEGRPLWGMAKPQDKSE